MYGYVGKIVRIDLSSRKICIEELNEDDLYNFIGGRGLGAWYLYRELDPKVDSLSSENKVIIMTGPLTGTGFPGSGRVCFISKSPLTGTICYSLMGGTFGAKLKFAGLDGIILEGSASKPTCILIENGKIELIDASNLWGLTTRETEQYLKSKFQNSSIACIGPAGENLVYFANIISENRAAGRGGLGAVLGSKRVKAIIVRGKGRVQIAHRNAFNTLLRKIRYFIETHSLTGINGALALHGTATLVHIVNAAKVLPINNFSRDASLTYRDVDNFSGQTIREKYLIKRQACYACTTGCGRIIKVKDEISKGPEYESIAMLGPNAGFLDFENEIYPLCKLCDDYGLDTISMGNIIGYARSIGLVKNIEDAKRLIVDISHGKSIFSKGLRYASKILGKEDKAIHVKGMELPAYHPEKLKGLALAYATANRGGCHTTAYTVLFEILGIPQLVNPNEEKNKPELVKRLQDVYAVIDSLIICKFHTFAMFRTLNFELDDIAKILSAVTGYYYDSEILYSIGENIYDLERLFNIRAGIVPEQDALPSILGVDISYMLQEYYKLRGWINGYPNPEVIKKRWRNVKKIERIELALTPIQKLTYPQLQVALDLDSSIDDICRVAIEAYAGGARIIEIGTPVLKRYGVDNIIPRIKEALMNYCKKHEIPYEAIILADTKTMDIGDLEARIAYRAGADIVTVLAIGSDNKILEAVSEAVRQDKAVMIDLIQVDDPLSRIEELVKKLRGLESWIIFCIHKGVSEQLRSRGIHDEIEMIRKVKEKVRNFKLAVAGGLKEGTIGPIASCGVDVLIVGSAIYRSVRPRETTMKILEEIRKNYRSS